jgi:hypothetical protein
MRLAVTQCKVVDRARGTINRSCPSEGHIYREGREEHQAHEAFIVPTTALNDRQAVKGLVRPRI